MNSYRYGGQELAIFSHAHRWKRYVGGVIRPYMGKRVLEVGAGIGTTASVLCDDQYDEWVCLEPDAMHKDTLEARIREGDLPTNCCARLGTVSGLGGRDVYDTVLYFDVVEHIEDDAAELFRAAEHIAPGGTLIVLAPARQWLFTDFDRAVGHHRRYSKSSLAALTPSGCRLVKLGYLDAAGMLLSLANRLLLRQATPTVRQIRFWDRWVVPVSMVLDPLTRGRIGKSVLGVWRRG